MILPDVNVLIYAFRQDVPEHAICHTWLKGVVASDATFGLSPLALSAVVRITTNLRPYANPSTLEDAFPFCDYLQSQPNCRLVTPGQRHWEIFRRLCVETDTR